MSEVVGASVLIRPRGEENGHQARELRLIRNRNQLTYRGSAYEDLLEIAQSAGAVVDTDIEFTRVRGKSSRSLYRDPNLIRRLLFEELDHDGTPKARASLGRLHFELGNYFHAECYLQDSLSNGIKDVGPLLVACHEQKGDLHRAREIANQIQGNGSAFSNLSNRIVPRDSTRLYLGAGTKSLPGYTHVDLAPGDHIDVVHDLNRRPWPWKDDSVDFIVAEDLVEHLDIDVLAFCNEAWRVLKSSGELFIRTPHHTGDSSWIDPTHRWHLNEQSFHYLDPETHWGQLYPQYTPQKWKLRSIGVRGPQNIHVLMTPRKPETAADSAESEVSNGT